MLWAFAIIGGLEGETGYSRGGGGADLSLNTEGLQRETALFRYGVGTQRP